MNFRPKSSIDFHTEICWSLHPGRQPVTDFSTTSIRLEKYRALFSIKQTGGIATTIFTPFLHFFIVRTNTVRITTVSVLTIALNDTSS